MRILFLSHYFPPEVNAPATRTREHCREWVKQGHDVTVVTCAPNHPSGVVYPGYRNRLWSTEDIDGIRVIRLWTYVTANEGFIKRTLNYVSYMFAAILAAPFLKSADIVISTSPQFFNGLAGYFVSRLKRCPWVLEIRDLWPESIVAVGAISNRMIIRMLEGIEMFAYRKADRIVPVTDAFRAYMVGKGIDVNRIEVIKNGVDLDLFRLVQPDSALAREHGLDGKFVAAYFGTHGMAHHLETILEAAELLSHRQDIAFLLIGDGANRKNLKRIRDDKGLSNVIMLDQVDKNAMPDYWSISGASLVLLRKSALFKTVLPSKIFESMAMKRPIVLGVEGESRELVEQAGAGVAIEPEDSSGLAQVIVQLADNAGLCRQYGESGHAFVSKYFDRKILALRYIGLLESLVQN